MENGFCLSTHQKATDIDFNYVNYIFKGNLIWQHLWAEKMAFKGKESAGQYNAFVVGGIFFFFLQQLLHFVVRQQGSAAEVSLLKILRLWLRLDGLELRSTQKTPHHLNKTKDFLHENQMFLSQLVT